MRYLQHCFSSGGVVCFGFFSLPASALVVTKKSTEELCLHLKEEFQRKLHSYWFCSNTQVGENSKIKLCHLGGLAGQKLCHILGVSSWLMTQQAPTTVSQNIRVPCKTRNIRMVLNEMEVDKCIGNQGAGILRLQEKLIFLPYATLLRTYYLWF